MHLNVYLLGIYPVKQGEKLSKKRLLSGNIGGKDKNSLGGLIGFPDSMCVCVFTKMHITAQSGPVNLVFLCHSHWSS